MRGAWLRPRGLGRGLHVLLTPQKSGWRVAGPGLEGGQLALLRLHVMARSQIATVSWSPISPLRDSEHEGTVRGSIVH